MYFFIRPFFASSSLSQILKMRIYFYEREGNGSKLFEEETARTHVQLHRGSLNKQGKKAF